MGILYNKPFILIRRRELRRNQTEAERVLWSRLRAKQFYGLKFRRQFSVGRYILDFYCRARRLAIEVDGGHHVEQRQYDDDRTRYLMSLGIRVIRFWNSEVLTNIEGVLVQVEKELNL